MENQKIVSNKIQPCLWFDNNAEEAVQYYTSIFNNSKTGTITRYGKGAPLPEGTALTVTFELEGQPFIALNGGPIFNFSEAISFIINCDTQQEVDKYWNALTSGGKEQQCGWLKDKYGLSWQVVPTAFAELMKSKDNKRVGNMMQALMKMKKLDLAELERAFNQ